MQVNKVSDLKLEENEIIMVCPRCGNCDENNLYIIKNFDYNDARLPFALMCGECCYVNVFDALDEEK